MILFSALVASIKTKDLIILTPDIKNTATGTDKAKGAHMYGFH